MFIKKFRLALAIAASFFAIGCGSALAQDSVLDRDYARARTSCMKHMNDTGRAGEFKDFTVRGALPGELSLDSASRFDWIDPRTSTMVIRSLDAACDEYAKRSAYALSAEKYFATKVEDRMRMASWFGGLCTMIALLIYSLVVLRPRNKHPAAA